MSQLTARKDAMYEGFTMTFANGYTISVQFGNGNYSSRNDDGIAVSAEIAIWDKDRTWYNFGTDNVKGWCSPDAIVTWMKNVKECEYTGDKWVMYDKEGDVIHNNAEGEPYMYDYWEEAMEDVGYVGDALVPTMVKDLPSNLKEKVITKELNQVSRWI